MASVSAPEAQVFTFPRAKKRGRKVLKGPKAEVHVLYRQEREATREMVSSWHAIDPGVRREQRRARMEELVVKTRAKIEAYHAWLEAQPYVVKFPAARRVRSLRDEGLIQMAYGDLMAREPGLTPEEGFRRALGAQEEAGPLIA